MLKQLPKEIVMTNGSVWHPKAGYYLADSDNGRIWSVKHNRWIRGQKVGKGYLKVELSCEEGQHPFLVHRLVWETFQGQIPQGLEVNHINENKEDNRLSNLNLLTHGDNMNHGTRIARQAAALSKSVYQYTTELELVNIHPSTREAARRQAYDQGAVAACCRGEQKTHKGFIWSYEPL